MGLYHCSRVFLKSELTKTPDDLVKFQDKDNCYQIVNNGNRKPNIPNPANVSDFIAKERFPILDKSRMHLKAADITVTYFEDN